MESLNLNTQPGYGQTCWLDAKQLDGLGVPAELRRWLVDRGSLTALMKQASNDQFQVQVLNQETALPLPDESTLLGSAADEPAMVRLVLLRCYGIPWVFARSVIPKTTIAFADNSLANIGNRPLGAYLFSHPLIERVSMEFAELLSDSPFWKSLSNHPSLVSETVWARRSLFTIGTHPLLVNEVFLPELGPYPI